MKSIDMEIHIQGHPSLLYERLSAPTEQQLRDLVDVKARDWSKNGLWSAWEAGGVNAKFYPAHRILSVGTYSVESFGEASLP